MMQAIPNPSVTVAIAIRHAGMRRAVSLVMQSTEDVHLVGQTGNQDDLDWLLLRERPAVTVLDPDILSDRNLAVSLPGLVAAYPHTAILVLTFESPETAQALTQLGAAGSLPKLAPTQQWLENIQAAARGGHATRR